MRTDAMEPRTGQPADRFIAALDAHGCKPRETGDSWMAACPAHEDSNPSLRVSVGNDGRVLLRCYAGCEAEAVCGALSLKLADLFADGGRRDLPPESPKQEFSRRRGLKVASLDLLGVTVHKNGNGPAELRLPMRDGDMPAPTTTGWQRRRADNGLLRLPDGTECKVLTVKGDTMALSYSPEALKAAPSDQRWIVTESAISVLACLSVDWKCVVGTSGADPSGHACGELQKLLAGDCVTLFPDPDPAGRQWRDKLGSLLADAACSVSFVAPSAGKDLADVLKAASDPAAELERLMACAVAWKAPVEADTDGSAQVQGKLDVRDFPCSDSGNGELLAAKNEDKLRFDHCTGCWSVRVGHHWQKDMKGKARQRAKTAARWRGKAALNLPADDEHKHIREKHVNWSFSSESHTKLDAALAEARKEPPLSLAGSEWNPDGMLLGVANGVVDLVTGDLRDGKASDLINMTSPVPYDPDAKCPGWMKFLDEIFEGDAELVSFIQRAVGYSLTGLTREHNWFFLYGRGANGKSVFISALMHVFGQYALTLPFSSFETQRSPSIPHDLADLPGKRLVVAAESTDGAAFDAAKLKNISGEDEIAARHLFKSLFRFQPTHKLWLLANRQPVVKDTSEGFWRRVLVVPFLRQFLGAAADPDMKKKLLKEAQGILTWAVEGAGIYQAMRLKPPDAVLAATESYRSENDPLAEFLAACCNIDTSLYGEPTIRAKEGFDAYLAWAVETGVPEKYQWGQRRFGREMGQRFTRDHDEHGKFYKGVELTPETLSKAAAGAGI